jgi:SAM-dependent methyltransferase
MKRHIKAVLKPLIPSAVLERRRKRQFEREQEEARDRPIEDVFTEIYESGTWAKEDGVRYHSGPGSLPLVSAGYEDFVVSTIDTAGGIHTLVDIGCGDFQVSNRILGKLKSKVRYIGCDIAANVVAYNSEKFGKPGAIEFRHVNVATDDVPAGDIVTIREVFQHLSNETIVAALANLSRNFKTAIVTESVFITPSSPNLDIVSGYRTRDGHRSGVYLELPPFNLKILDRYEQAVNDEETLRTLVVSL